ncbi:hypothetical protein B0H14DRAFT_3893003 [Mycena olivaceomarginata]|nr:hypothetical protein B0H14DRAFT_3893003 [Mycena olivaceomarginata]
MPCLVYISLPGELSSTWTTRFVHQEHPHSHGFKRLSAQFLALGVNTTAVSGRWWGRCWIKFDSSPYSTTKHSHSVTFVLGAPFAPPNTCRTPAAVDPSPCFALLGQDHATRVDPDPSTLSQDHRVPHAAMGGALLMSLNFYKIAPIGAAAELQDIGGQRGEAAMGCYPPGLPPVTLFCFFDVSPSRRSNAASSQLTHANGWLKSRDTTVSRHQILSALFQHHRVPHAAYAFIFDAPVPPRRTDFSPHIPSSPHDTRPYRLCPVCSGPPTSTLLADTFVCQRSRGCQQSTAACSCLPVRERPLRASPDRSPPIGAPYELWGIEAEWGRLAIRMRYHLPQGPSVSEHAELDG